MVRLKRGRPRKNVSQSNSQHYPEFFRIYLPEHNSKALSIPPTFVENFNGHIPKKVVLKNSHGKYWHVELEEVGGKLLFNGGWEALVNSNSLVRGDFMIFQYNGNGLFTVKVFGLNGCNKDETTVTTDQLDVKVELEEGERSEQIVSDHTGTCEQKHSEKDMVEDKNPSGSHETMTCIPDKAEGSRVRFSKVLESKRHYEMGIPLGVIIAHKIDAPKVNSPETIILRNRNKSGASQRVIFRRRLDRRVEIAKGWRDFCVYNNIGHGDEVEFEIILDKLRKVREIVLLQVNRKQRRNRTYLRK